MKNKKKYLFLLVLSLAMIPLVHLVAPLFYPEVPKYVSTGEGSIIGQTNVYAQLLPYVIAYLLAPVLFVWSLVKLFKANKAD